MRRFWAIVSMHPYCRLCIDIPHYPHPSPDPNPNPNPIPKPNETTTPENTQRIEQPGTPGIIQGQKTCYVATEVPYVHQACEFVEPSDAREDFNDDNDPVVLVITGKTRDNFLHFLKQFASTTPVGYTGSSEMINTDALIHDQAQHQTQDQPDVFLQNILNSKDFNYSTAAGLKRQFENTCNKLDGIQLDFHESELKENLSTSSETEKFREVRKTLTDFYVFGHKTVNLSRKVQDGDHSYILKANLNIIPNRIESKTLENDRFKIYDRCPMTDVAMAISADADTDADVAYRIYSRISRSTYKSTP